METNSTSTPLQARTQPSIRSFFQPRTPSYTAPPGAITSKPTSATSLPLKQTSPYSPPQPSPPQVPKSNPNILPQATISMIRQEHIQPLRRINSLLLPIHYPDSFYHKILEPLPTPSFSRVIQWVDPDSTEAKVIGGIICRLDSTPTPDFSPTNPTFIPGCYDIYIQSLALLSPYRSKGLAAAVLNEVISNATLTSTSPDGVRIAEIYAHVWTQNDEALEWYAKRGFKRDEYAVVGYYRRLKPDSAWVLRRRILPSDHLQSLPVSNPPNGAAISNSPSPAPSLKLPPQSVLEARSGNMTQARSFQEKGPEREWNDLPEDVLGSSLLKPTSQNGSAEASRASSRSSSRSGTGGKKKRVYPAAAFGS
ncbi:hypothetical protein G7Y89_g9438 [Cudoniella acicularis]|uniref:N-acetyltransferase domain-containing protein n=1 Tax=Cudoniella acicularis TaxID=354080 RepID=A0A8H4RGV5_9HELO|nr:hypothetical protein G7Y89_g9438 [Cudoniella acicularis]